MEEETTTRTNVDEEGNELTEDQLEGRDCVMVEEVFDDDRKIIGYIYHYQKVPEPILRYRETQECKARLSETDIDIVRASESLLEALTGTNTLSELLVAVKDIHDTNKEVIDKRKEWRNRIRKITKG